MSKVFAVALAIASTAFFSDPGFSMGKGRVEVTLKEAEGYACSSNCESLHLNYTLSNRGNILECVSGHYVNSDISEYIKLIDGHGKQYKQIVALPEPSNLGNRHDQIRSSPNVIIQANSNKNIDVYVLNKFSFPKETEKLNIAFEIYPCDERDFKKYGFSYVTIEKVLSYK